MSAMNFYDMPPKDGLKQSLLTGDEGVILAALKTAKKSARRKYLNEILLILSNTHSARVRNVAAIAVADFRSENIKEALLDLLLRNDTRKSRGTLLYVLDEIGASIPIDILTRIIATSRYEAREEALAFLKSQKIDWNPQQLQRSIRKLERMTLSKNVERSKAAERVLEFASKLIKSRKGASGRRSPPKSKMKKVA
jgi:hypothetical protein